MPLLPLASLGFLPYLLSDQTFIYLLYHKPGSDCPPRLDIAVLSLRPLPVFPSSETKGLHTLSLPQPHSQLQRGAILLVTDGVNAVTIATPSTNDHKNRQAWGHGEEADIASVPSVEASSPSSQPSLKL